MSTTRWISLRRQLLWLLLGGVTAGWLATLVLSYAKAHHEIDELFDAQLVQAAQSLLALSATSDDDDDIALPAIERHHYQKTLVFQLWHRNGQLLLRSAEAPLQPLASADGFSNAGGWRYYMQYARDGERHVIVGEDHEVREDLAKHIAVRLLGPALLGLPLLGFWVWFATRRALAPLDALAASVAQRSPQHLAALAPARAPAEVRPLIEALNDLFLRVARALDAERRFTSDAAHELRTPLAAVAAQGQVAARARDDAERDHALALMAASSKRASHLVDQLLVLARLDPDNPPERTPVRLDELSAQVCADHGTAALARDITLELDAPAPVTVHANGTLLAIALRNLIDNAVRYTPRGGMVRVGLTADDGAARLTVSDNGPGIPAGQRAQVLERFYRLGGQDTEGSGLGLSIVARIVALHGAQMTLGEGLAAGAARPGLAVTMRFAG